MTTILLLCATLTGTDGMASANLRSVTDYFRSLQKAKPDVLDADLEIEVEDKKNGYLKLGGPFEGYAEFVIFRRNNGAYTVGYALSSCGGACETYRVLFYEYDAVGASWRDVTKDVLPDFKPRIRATMTKKFGKVIANDEGQPAVLVKLPQKGRSIAIAVDRNMADKDADVILFHLDWDGSQFKVK